MKHEEGWTWDISIANEASTPPSKWQSVNAAEL